MTKTSPDTIRASWLTRGWPEDLLDRALEQRVRWSRVKRWVKDERWTPDRIREALERRSREPRARQATWDDNGALADLYAHAPEAVDDGQEVIVERGPFAFAQFALQDSSEVHVVDDGDRLLAALGHATTTLVAGGIQTLVYVPLGWRVRHDCRGEGLGPMLQKGAHQRFAGPEVCVMYYRRHIAKRAALATVYCYPAQPAGRSGPAPGAAGIRRAGRSDLGACLPLINSVQQRHDVSRHYDADYLAARLDGAGPESRASVYGWQDYYVMEDTARIVACGGLWDRGRHMREVWRGQDGVARTIENTALLDFGYADGREDAMAEMIEYFMGLTADLGRDQLMAALQFLPQVTARLAQYNPASETRAWYWHNNAALRRTGFKASRPYIDLAYW